MSAKRRSTGGAARGVRAPLAGTGDGHRAESVGGQATAEAFACEGAEVAVSRQADRDGAGTGMSGMIVAEIDDSRFEQMMPKHLPGPLWCDRAFIRSRKAAGSGGRIVSIGSVAGHLPMPGSAIATPMAQEWPDDPGKRPESMEAIPWGRPGRPEEITGLAVFLASDAVGYVTGQTWTVAGGLTMNRGGA